MTRSIPTRPRNQRPMLASNANPRLRAYRFYHLCIAASPFVATLIILTHPIILPHSSRSSHPPKPPKIRTYLPDSCHFIGHNPSNSNPIQFNTRSLCLASSICLPYQKLLSSYFHPTSLPPPTCTFHHPDLSPTPYHLKPPVTCSTLRKSTILCAHGPGHVNNTPACPEITSYSFTPSTSIRWFDDITILVPPYPFPTNIFHYSTVITVTSYLIENLNALLSPWLGNQTSPSEMPPSCSNCPPVNISNINIIFHGPVDVLTLENWQKELLAATIDNHMETKGLNIKVYHLTPSPTVDLVCIRNAVVLGKRGHLNMWAFPNATEVPLHGRSVPIDAVRFRRAVYDVFKIPSQLPNEEHLLSELPPLKVGYARREAIEERQRPGMFLKFYDVRRFSEEDEAWFVEMLRNETGRAGVELEVFTTFAGEPLRKQVQRMTKVGFVVGIHGANLVNGIFMHPFGAMLELSPALVRELCYVGGMNSGLKYMRHEMSAVASVVESGCETTDVECAREYKHRRVKLGKEKDRFKVRDFVREGIRHLKILHEVFPKGVPVFYNRKTGYYDIEWAASR